jgi:hypothetical protein
MSDKRESSRAARQHERQLRKQESQDQARSRPREARPGGPERTPQVARAFDVQGQDSDAPSWLREGRFAALQRRQYGYPDCCILFFHRVWGPLAWATVGIASKVHRGEPCTDDELSLYGIYLEHRKHLDGTGYVPCPGCPAKRLGGAELLPSLLSEEPCPCCECQAEDDSAEDDAPGSQAGSGRAS